MTDMAVEICGVRFKNPVIAASGTFSFGREFETLFDISLLGGICFKALTKEPRQGNPPPRVAETPCGMLNSVGLQNPGVRAFVRDILPRVKEYDTVKIANVAGACAQEYVDVIEALNETPLNMFELNISCPNVKKGGMQFGADAASAREITIMAKKAAKKPLIVKLSPNVADIADIARAAQEGGADAISLVNTVAGMAIDARARRPVLGNVTGGLSGPAIKPLALRMVYEASRAVSIPVIGMGGIMTGVDAAEFMIAGASAVMAGTAVVCDPFALPRIIGELRAFAQEEGIKSIRELTGTLAIQGG